MATVISIAVALVVVLAIALVAVLAKRRRSSTGETISEKISATTGETAGEAPPRDPDPTATTPRRSPTGAAPRAEGATADQRQNQPSDFAPVAPMTGLESALAQAARGNPTHDQVDRDRAARKQAPDDSGLRLREILDEVAPVTPVTPVAPVTPVTPVTPVAPSTQPRRSPGAEHGDRTDSAPG